MKKTKRYLVIIQDTENKTEASLETDSLQSIITPQPLAGYAKKKFMPLIVFLQSLITENGLK